MKEMWTLHIDLISQPNGLDPDASISLHLTFPSRQAMNNCFSHYHARIGEIFTVPGQYTIIGVEPDLFPTKTERIGDDDDQPIT